jgi:cation transport protein ChaC
LRAREQVSGVYREAHVPVELIKGPHAEVMALTYIAERAHPNYAGRLPLAVEARLIHGAAGLSGANLDYFLNTLRHLQELDIRERDLERLLAVIAPHAARLAPSGDSSPHTAAMVRLARLRRPARRARLPRGDRRFLHRGHLGA